MLAYGAVAVLIAVVAGVGAMLGLDSRRERSGHWLDVVRQWQGLIGSVLGFLTAASVLVLGQALTSYEASARAQTSAHAIGFGLALEAERISSGLRSGLDIGNVLQFEGVDLTGECQRFTDEILTRDLPQDDPVYKAVLADLEQFGEANLATFVRFFAFYDDFRHELTLERNDDCVNNPADTMKYIVRRLDGGQLLYQVIANEYHTIGVTEGNGVLSASSQASATG
jgi:hypothetical protein